MASKASGSGRRRGRRRSAPRSGPSSSQARASLVNPQANRNSPFSHIQIVSRESAARPGRKRKETVPDDWEDEVAQWDESGDTSVFQSPSYHTAAASESGGAPLNLDTSTETPVRPSSRTTFADITRAPTHSAGKGEDKADSASSVRASTTSGIVKLKPTIRPKGRKAWEPFDLSTLEQDDDMAEQPPDEHLLSTVHAMKPQPTQFKDSDEAIASMRSLQTHIENAQRIFGAALLDHRELLSHMGEHDLIVKFTMEPNGDITAHHWILQHYHWRRFGEYYRSSNSIDGHIDFLALYGKIGYAAPNLLEHFKMMSYQYMPKPDPLPNNVEQNDHQDAGNSAPANEHPIHNLSSRDTMPPHLGKLHSFRSFSSAGFGSPGPDMAALGGLRINDQPESRQEQQQGLEDPFTNPHGRAFSSNPPRCFSGNLDLGVTGATQRPASIDPDYRFPPPPTIHQGLNPASFIPMTEESPETQRLRIVESERRRNRLMQERYMQGQHRLYSGDEGPLSSIPQYTASQGPSLLQNAASVRGVPPVFHENMLQRAAAPYAQRMSSLQSLHTTQGDAGLQTSSRLASVAGAEPFAYQLQPRQQEKNTKTMMKEYLLRMDAGMVSNISHPERPKRTVGNDPLQTGRMNVGGCEQPLLIKGRGAGLQTTSLVPPTPVGVSNMQYSSSIVSANGPFRTLRMSSTPESSSNLPTLASAPNVGHYMGLFRSTADDHSKATKRDDWWLSGSVRTRQQETQLARLPSAASTSRTDPRRPLLAVGPGPIERPSPSAGARSRPLHTSADADTGVAKTPSDMSLLLFKVAENLAQYSRERHDLQRRVAGVPPEEREAVFATQRCYFARFAAPARRVLSRSFFGDSSEQSVGDGAMVRDDSLMGMGLVGEGLPKGSVLGVES